jgi:hypothetical protein
LRTQPHEAQRQAGHLFQTLLHRAFRGSYDQTIDHQGVSDARTTN